MIKTFRLNIGVFTLLFFVLLFPAGLIAQEYGGGLLGYGEKGAEQQRGPLIYIDYYVDGNNFGNQPFGVDPTNYDYSPIGNGWFFFVLAGVGYALVKSKKSRSKSYIVITTLSLVLGLTQCKKDTVVSETPVLEGEKYTISLDLGGASNTKADVYPFDGPDIAPVYYEVGDVIEVVYGGIKVGTMVCDSSFIPADPIDYLNDYARFKGEVTIATPGDWLYFYFVGNQTQTTGTSTFVVDLSDQTAQLPVISYARSKEPFAADRDHYTIYNGYNNVGANWLLNQCALVKFECENIYDMSANTNDNNPYAIYKTGKPITIYGMDNHVVIDLSKPGADDQFVWTKEGSGAMILYRSPRELDSVARYAIVHHKDYTSVTAGELSVPYNPASDQYGFFGTYKIAHNVKKNDYFDGAKIDLVWHSGAFTINGDGDQVVFSRGNLQYKHYGSATADGGIWRFAKHQYDWVGGMVGSDAWHYNNVRQGNVVLRDGVSGDTDFSTNEQIGEASYVGWIDLYGYGTGDDPTKHSIVNSQYNDWNEWGTHSIVNSGKPGNTSWWRTLSHHEWKYLLSERDGYSSKRGTATVNGVKGFVLLPDCSTATIVSYSNHALWENNTYTTEQWKAAEAAGAVFLPCAGYRNGTDFDGGTNADQDHGVYHSSSMSTSAAAWGIRFKTTNNYAYLEDDYPMAPDNGHAVRLVHKLGTGSKFGFTKKD